MVRLVENGMQDGNNTSVVRLQTSEGNAIPAMTAAQPSDAVGTTGEATGTVQLQPAGGPKSTLDTLKGMTVPDVAAGVALVVGIVLVMRHFGWKKAGRAADENLAHLEQARLLAQAARYQAATDALGEVRAKPTQANLTGVGASNSMERRTGDGRTGEDRMSRRVDEKIDRLERLIAEADRRIRRLEDLGTEAGNTRMTVERAATIPGVPRIVPSGESSGLAPEKPSGVPAKGESRLIEPRTDATPDDWQSRTRQLASGGLSAREIAFKLGKPIGHVELVLALQRGQIAG